MELSVYPEYKNSGVDWLGEVPEHWEVLPLRNIASFQNGHGFPHDLQGQEEGDFPFVKVSDISFLGKELKQSENYVNAVNIKNNKWQIVPRKSVILPKIGEALKLNHRKVLSLDGLIDNNILAIKPSNKIQYSWLYYLLLSIDMGWVSNPSTVPTIDMEQLKSLSMPLPYYQEQTQIAKFLDHKTAQIDRLIEKKKALIEKLNEKRTALITQAVTKGLNPDVPMKDSGVDWLGEVPEHWEVRKLKWTIDNLKNGIWGEENNGIDDIICIRVADFDRNNFTINDSNLTLRSIDEKDRSSRLLKPGDLLIEKSGGGENQLVGAVVQFDKKYEAITSNFVARMSISKGFSSRYLTYLHAHIYSSKLNYRSIKQSTGIQNLDSELYFAEQVAIAPKSEQIQIAEFLDNKTNKIDKLANKASEAIDTLNEYRTALITAAVTGKIDVRNVSILE